MGVVTANILQNGRSVEPGFQLLSIDILREYNRIPTAELVYIDGDPATRAFPLADSNCFGSGTEIEIKLRYEGLATKEQTVFKGLVTGQGLKTTGGGCSLLVQLSDKAIKMTAVRKNFVYEQVLDSDVIGTLISQNGIDSGVLSATTVTHKKLVQFAATDWDFLLCRAEANGLLVLVKDGTIAAQVPEISGSAKQTFTFGLDEIYSFDFESDTRYQYSSIKSFAWDAKSQQVVESDEGKAFRLSQDLLNADAIYEPMGNAEELLVSGTGLEEKEAQAWADAKMIKNRMSVLRGSIRVEGDAGIEIGDIVELKGLSQLFSGKTIVTGIRHQVSSGGWYTDLQFGLPADSFATQYNIKATEAGGLLPAVNGLQIGIVERFEADPDKEFRVKVKIPAMGTENNTLWARLAMPDGGKERGVLFFPEPEDEVVLGFLNDDPRQAIVIGSLYSSAHTVPFVPEDENPMKGMVTRSGLKLVFDDKKKQVTLSTSDDQQIVMNEEDKSIEIKDLNGNSVKLNSDGITLASSKDVIIQSDGDVKIKASGNVEIKGTKTDVI